MLHVLSPWGGASAVGNFLSDSHHGCRRCVEGCGCSTGSLGNGLVGESALQAAGTSGMLSVLPFLFLPPMFANHPEPEIAELKEVRIGSDDNRSIT